jgi:pimeloyl-ACP methyl ester carboxylesterase
MGGMIAQELAIKYPGKVKKLVLGVTTSYPKPEMKKVLNNWIKIAEEGNYKKLIMDMAEKTYSEKYLTKLRKYYPIITKIGKPKSFRHFIVEAKAHFSHNTYNELLKIKCPTMIIGGAKDNIVDKASILELADRINNSKLLLYENSSYSVIFEEKNCFSRIVDFLKIK